MSDFDYRFSIIPGWIVTDPRLKGRDLQVLCLLGRHTNKTDGWCRRSQVKMAAQLDISRSTVQASLNRLVEFGAVERRIVESPDGRDSAHRYRVIYDREVDSVAISAWEDEDEAEEIKENDPIPDASVATPPADISAGGAAPESAPPAGPGSAPIKDSLLRPPFNQTEREPAARESGQEEDPRATERDFKKFFFGWGTAVNDSEPDARREWQALSSDERDKALELSGQYQAIALSTGRKYLCAAAKYLREKRWLKLPELGRDRSKAVSTPEGYTAYSRAGTALRLSLLSRAPVPLRLTMLEERIIADKPDKEEMIWRDKREKQGWPDAIKLHEAAANRRKVQVPVDIVALSQGFQAVRVSSPVWLAWKALFHDRCWPWMEEPQGLDWIYLPALPEGIEDPDEAVVFALKAFQRKLLEGWGNDDAA